ncbi:hypothetical protein MBLNU230_g2292t1 [Neophaeotheca triangularis]
MLEDAQEPVLTEQSLTMGKGRKRKAQELGNTKGIITRFPVYKPDFIDAEDAEAFLRGKTGKRFKLELEYDDVEDCTPERFHFLASKVFEGFWETSNDDSDAAEWVHEYQRHAKFDSRARAVAVKLVGNAKNFHEEGISYHRVRTDGPVVKTDTGYNVDRISTFSVRVGLIIKGLKLNKRVVKDMLIDNAFTYSRSHYRSGRLPCAEVGKHNFSSIPGSGAFDSEVQQFAGQAAVSQKSTSPGNTGRSFTNTFENGVGAQKTSTAPHSLFIADEPGNSAPKGGSKGRKTKRAARSIVQASPSSNPSEEDERPRPRKLRKLAPAPSSNAGIESIGGNQAEAGAIERTRAFSPAIESQTQQAELSDGQIPAIAPDAPATFSVQWPQPPTGSHFGGRIGIPTLQEGAQQQHPGGNSHSYNGGIMSGYAKPSVARQQYHEMIQPPAPWFPLQSQIQERHFSAQPGVLSSTPEPFLRASPRRDLSSPQSGQVLPPAETSDAAVTRSLRQSMRYVDSIPSSAQISPQQQRHGSTIGYGFLGDEFPGGSDPYAAQATIGFGDLFNEAPFDLGAAESQQPEFQNTYFSGNDQSSERFGVGFGDVFLGDCPDSVSAGDRQPQLRNITACRPSEENGLEGDSLPPARAGFWNQRSLAGPVVVGAAQPHPPQLHTTTNDYHGTGNSRDTSGFGSGHLSLPSADGRHYATYNESLLDTSSVQADRQPFTSDQSRDRTPIPQSPPAIIDLTASPTLSADHEKNNTDIPPTRGTSSPSSTELNPTESLAGAPSPSYTGDQDLEQRLRSALAAEGIFGNYGF